MTHTLISSLRLALIAIAVIIFCAQVRAPVQIQVPNPDEGTDSLASRAQSQMGTTDQFKVPYQFRFVDRIKESGITFHYQAVSDALDNYKAIHYDHGSAVAAADVDGDGRPDLLLLNQVDGNQLWKNLGAGKFKNITEEAGIALTGIVSVGAAFADIDNDGDEDLVITTVRKGVHLFENDGKGHFKDISKEAGINIEAHSTGAFFFDFDRDGLLDLLVCNVGRFTTDKVAPDGSYVGVTDAFAGQMFPDRYEHPVLYKNLGNNHFKDVTAQVGLTPRMWCGDATFADLNGDGWPDLYLLNMQGDDHYYENQNGKRFVEKTRGYFPKTPWGSMGVKFFDFDNDGRLDLLITDMHSDMSEEVGPEKEKLKSNIKFPPAFLMTHGTSIFGNALYHNLGSGKFEEISDRMGVETYWPWGVSVADLNADGWEDVFVTGGMGYPFRYGINSVLLNNRGQKFLDSEFLLGVEPRPQKRTRGFSFELDCSQPQQGRAQQLCLGKSGKIDVMGTLSSRSSVVLDVDDDGDLDIVTNDFNSEPMMLISDLSDRQPIHWIKVALVGSTSNRDGIGAMVRVHAGSQMYTKQNDGKSGYLAQSVLPLYFGLGEATKVDSIEVEWPSGHKQIVDKNIVLNTTIRVTEPKPTN